MASLALREDISVLLDDSDADLVASVRWVPVLCGKKNKKLYAIGWCKKTKRSVFMHRVLMGAKTGQLVDHINGDTLNNTRANLRICSGAENNANAKYTTGISGYRGVYVQRGRRPYVARISVDGRMVSLGSAEMPEEAAKIYDAAAIRQFGGFATLNFPSTGA